MKKGEFKVSVTKEELEHAYLVEKLSLSEVGKRYGVVAVTIRNWMRHYGIPTRTVSNAQLKQLSGDYGNWRVIELSSLNPTKWKCQCLICGRVIPVLAKNLVSGTSTRCVTCHDDFMRTGHMDIPGWFWARATASAINRGIVFKIPIQVAWEEYEKQNGICSLSGMRIGFTKESKTTTASFDRIDSGGGYEIGNVQWIHKDINRMKWSHEQGYFLNLCSNVARHQEYLISLSA